MTAYADIFLEKARNYCAYQERCIDDVKKKLESWKLNEEAVLDIIKKLKKEGYIDEERFARAYAVGKFRNNKWGRNKIFYGLSRKNIPELYIQIGLAAIDEEEYINTLKGLLSSKTVKAETDFERKIKLVRYAVQKGYQQELVWRVLEENEV